MICVIKHLQIKNFRGFKTFELDNMKQITLLSGLNNVGKSTVLESIFLMNDHFVPDVFLKLNVFRGMEKQPMISFAPFFFNEDIAEPMEIGISTDNKEYKLSLQEDDSYVFPVTSDMPIEIKQMLTSEPTGQSKASTLLFEFSEGQNYEEVGHFLIRANNVYKNTTSAPKTILRMPFTQYISPRMGNDVAQVSEWFGKLELSDKKNLVVQAMQEFDSSIVDVSTIVSNGFAQLYAKVNNKLLPLKILGDGTNRLLLMQLAILANPNGIILIDEIENGFHYSVLPTLWKTLFSAAKLANCQIIATTHSYECIQNAIDYATRNSEEDRFGFVRLEKRNEDVCAKPFSINALDYAVKSEIEVR